MQRDKFLCVHCLKVGRVTTATDCDHIVPIAIAPELRLELDNLQCLCRPCHRIKTADDHKSRNT